MSEATKHEPMPTKSTGDLWKDVISDMEERRIVGIERYGTPLQPNNGRRPEVDLYQELLDASVYGKQLIVEMSMMRKRIIKLENALNNLLGHTRAESEYEKLHLESAIEEAQSTLKETK